MLGKLLKKDLNRNMRWMWILFVSTILVAGITRGFKELGESIMFFKILGIFFDSVFYSLVVNVIIQPFLRNFLNFTKSFYGDESYLTHTLPATKTQLITSKFLTAIIEITLGFACLVTSLLIMFYTPTMFDKLGIFISIMFGSKLSVALVLTLFIVMVVVEFLMFISLIYFSIVIAYRSKERRVLKTFLLTLLMSLASITILSVVMMVVLAINGVKLTSATLTLSSSVFTDVMITGIVVYSLIGMLFYFITRRAFNKGVNVD